MEIVALYAAELPEQQAVPGGSHPVQHNIHPLDSSRGFARTLLPLHQNESAHPRITSAAQNVGSRDFFNQPG